MTREELLSKVDGSVSEEAQMIVCAFANAMLRECKGSGTTEFRIGFRNNGIIAFMNISYDNIARNLSTGAKSGALTRLANKVAEKLAEDHFNVELAIAPDPSYNVVINVWI